MSGTDWSLSEYFEKIAEVELGFADALVVSGIGSRQLRNGLDRGSLSVGRKHPRVDRWIFTPRDCVALMIVAELTSATMMPVGQADEIGKHIAQTYPYWADKYFATNAPEVANKKDGDPLDAAIFEYIATWQDSQLQVLVHVRGNDWGFYQLDGTKTDLTHFDEAHVRLPLMGITSRFLNGMSEVLGASIVPNEGEGADANRE